MLPFWSIPWNPAAITIAPESSSDLTWSVEIERIRARRSVEIRLEETMRAPAAPSDAAWQARWERAVASLGLPVHRMPSGAGHDAMMLHRVMPQAMLFMRGLNSGISHNPLEGITNDDAELVVRAFAAMLDDLAADAALRP